MTAMAMRTASTFAQMKALRPTDDVRAGPAAVGFPAGRPEAGVPAGLFLRRELTRSSRTTEAIPSRHSIVPQRAPARSRRSLTNASEPDSG